jgi:hypothetical protein
MLLKFGRNKIMGVDFYSCTLCGYGFPDCGDYVRCDCGRRFCSDECADMAYDENDEGSCIICQKENADDSTLFNFLLTHYKLTREDVMKMWQNTPDEDEPDTEPENK